MDTASEQTPVPDVKPSLARNILVFVPDVGVYPALVTCVHSDTCLNASVFVDGEAHVLPLKSLTYDPLLLRERTWAWPPRV